jgi:hypothetical protein
MPNNAAKSEVTSAAKAEAYWVHGNRSSEQVYSRKNNSSPSVHLDHIISPWRTH